ncbi:MAG: N-acetylneuraminate synthase family protein, partial [Planctomycetes bacterium]|nr:N-acetylneuraminate synthase family protein [Planctomycetota bacterium]
KGEVDFLVDKLNVPFIKIASMDVNNYPFLKYVARKQLPIVISTGLSELHEIDKAIKTIEGTGNKQIIILHCASNYPPDDTEVNLNKIKTYKKLYQYPIGFSDHTLGTAITLASVVFGVGVIEKHFTLDKKMDGWDHAVSADPADLKTICAESKRIVKALGGYQIKAIESDKQRKGFRRSIVTARKINAGETITEADILYKRPGTGISPGDAEYVIGRKVKRSFAEDELLRLDGLE